LLGFAWLNRPKYVSTIENETWSISVFYMLNSVSFTLLSCALWMGLQNKSLATLILVLGALLGLSSAFFQDAVLARAGRSGPKATQVYLLGFSLSAVSISGFNAGVAPSMDERTSGTALFVATVITLVLGMIVFLVSISKTKSPGEASEPVEIEEPLLDQSSERRASNTWTLRLSIAVVAIILAGTLSVFPGIVSAIKPRNGGSSESDFTLLLFFYFNLGDGSGRLLANHLLSRMSSGALLALALIRTLSLGLFALTNVNGTSNKAMSDDGVCQLVFLQAMTSGMLLTGAAMRAPQATPAQPAVGAKAVAATIAVSLAVGALVGNLLVKVAL
jgi:hypothetical protein